MARLQLLIVFIIVYSNSINCESFEQRGNKSLQKRQRSNRYPRGRGILWDNATSLLSSISEENAAPNSSEDIMRIVTRQQSENTPGSRDGILYRINERLSALLALDQQQLKRFESLEYRYTKFEVQMQERAESIRNEVREILRKVQQFDWQSEKIESTVDMIKEDTAFVRQGLEQLRASMSQVNSGDKYLPSPFMTELQGKLQTLQVSVQMIRSSIVNIANELSSTKRNVSEIMNATYATLAHGKQLPTIKYFNAKVSELKSVPQTKICTLETSTTDEGTLFTDCRDALKNGHDRSGIYKIRPSISMRSFYVYCQMETHGGGWTVIQNRNGGTIDFYKDWQDYKLGFGNLLGEFWLGLHYVYMMTNIKIHEILIELKDHDGVKVYSSYDAFAVGPEIEGYPLKILGKYNGTSGDSLAYHAGQKFSTMDFDNDNWVEGNCAASHTGAWWYNSCDTSNLNGRYLNRELPEDYEYQGAYWYDWHGPSYALMETRISIRPRDGIHSKTEGKKATGDAILIEETTSSTVPLISSGPFRNSTI